MQNVSSNFVQALESPGFLAITKPGIGESIAGAVQRMSLLVQMADNKFLKVDTIGYRGYPKIFSSFSEFITISKGS